MALPTLIAVLAVGLYALAGMSLQARCADAASAGARQLARGDEPAMIRVHLLGGLPPESSVTFGRAEPDLVTVRVAAPLPAPAGIRTLVSRFQLSATATAADEAA